MRRRKESGPDEAGSAEARGHAHPVGHVKDVGFHPVLHVGHQSSSNLPYWVATVCSESLLARTSL